MLICIGRIQEAFELDHQSSAELLNNLKAYIEPEILNTAVPVSHLMDYLPADLECLRASGQLIEVDQVAIKHSVGIFVSESVMKYNPVLYEQTGPTRVFMNLVLEQAYRLYFLASLAQGVQGALRLERWEYIYRSSFRSFDPVRFRLAGVKDEVALEKHWKDRQVDLQHTLSTYFTWWMTYIARVDRHKAFDWLKLRGLAPRKEVRDLTRALFAAHPVPPVRLESRLSPDPPRPDYNLAELVAWRAKKTGQ
ncbi:hypothetical protein C4J81_00490 [Deltaproteobacteria bacterium Smac51]|nr:hypothetical protein C4J81_00490 [Deltaproteobacteria bacterium Smac51]